MSWPRLRKGSLLLPLSLGIAAALLLSGVVTALRWGQYWNYSEGVYALTARDLLHGHGLYGRLVVAQPPVIFGVGAAALWVSDTLGSLRVELDLFQVAGGALAAVAVVRLTGARWLATAVVPLAVLLPWAVHEEGILTPELVALPMLLGGSLLAARRHTALAAGLVLALACGAKVPYVVPAAAVALAVPDRRRVLIGLAAGLLVQGGLYLLLFGPGVWGDVVVAQLQSTHRPAYRLVELAPQVLWSLLGLLGGCGLYVVRLLRGARGADRAQERASLALAAGTAATAASVLKTGTDLNILVPIELTLLPVAAAGCWLAWRAAARPARLVARAGVVALLALVLVQSGSLLARPTAPGLFTYPGYARVRGGPHVHKTWAVYANADAVRATAAFARRCPAGQPWGGAPFYAFLSHRTTPDGQADPFITRNVPYHAATRRRMLAQRPWCGGRLQHPTTFMRGRSR